MALTSTKQDNPIFLSENKLKEYELKGRRASLLTLNLTRFKEKEREKAKGVTFSLISITYKIFTLLYYNVSMRPLFYRVCISWTPKLHTWLMGHQRGVMSSSKQFWLKIRALRLRNWDRISYSKTILHCDPWRKLLIPYTLFFTKVTL